MARPTVVVELAADAKFARELVSGGVYVDGCDLALDSLCDLVVRGADEEVVFDARVVLRDPARGAALELLGFCPALKEQLELLIAATPGTMPMARLDDDDDDAVGEFDDLIRDVAAFDAEYEDDLALAIEGEPVQVQVQVQLVAAPPPAPALSIDELDDACDEPAMIHSPPLDGAPALVDTAEPEGNGNGRSNGDGDPEHRGAALTVHERLRRLTLPQQLKKAHSGELQERIVLERMYGKTVWEPLLRNPRLTAPEVARIARMGQLPKPLIEIIVGNGAWLQVPEVRRALLSNPRLAVDQVTRVLRMLPKHELKLASVQTAYPHAVRDAAKRMLRES